MNRGPHPDDDPNIPILGPGKVRDFGEVEAAAATPCGATPGPIRLLNGYPTARGWGYRHITSNPQRVRLIQGRGFGSPVMFAFAVASGWRTLHQAAGPLDRIAVVFPQGGFDLALALQWHPDGFWSITTMLPFRVHNQPKLYER